MNYPTSGRGRAFRLGPPTVDRESVRQLARDFQLAGGLDAGGGLYEDARLLTYSEWPWELTVHSASGGMRLRDTTRWQVDDRTSNVDYDDDTAVGIARGLVEQRSLVPPDEYRLLRVSRLRVGAVEVATRKAEERVIDIGVAFQRVIEGVPVFGPGGKLIVYLGGEGALIGVQRIWRDVREVAVDDAELRPPEQALAEARDLWDDPRHGTVTVGEPRFGYLEAGWDETQTYLQPAYYMPVNVTAPAGPFAGQEILRSEHITAALVEPPAPLLAGPPKVTPPPYRTRTDAG